MTLLIILSINNHLTSPFYLAVLGNCDLLSGLKENCLMKNLLSISDLTNNQIKNLILLAKDLKAGKKISEHSLKNKSLALLFEKPSLRTRASFELGIKQLGGNCVYLDNNNIGMGNREPVKDIANVLDRWFDGIIARVFDHETLTLLEESCSIPIINALSDIEHPCQALSDMLTIDEKLGHIENTKIVFIGDGNNVAISLALCAAALGVNFTMCSPEKYKIDGAIWKTALAQAQKTGSNLEWNQNPHAAVEKADVIYTDVWVSMGDEDQSKQRIQDFGGYQVTPEIINLAKNEAIFMHDMPAHDGEEISSGLLYHPQSVVFDQAENRLHMQKAILSSLLK
ncbi:MAG: ornithine carbamoyltransferase [Chloroflexi bacterium]|nr:MAG: ornithine carbamoyltransferase [Chloroflexota bacterium]